MWQLFKLTRVLLPVLALLAVSVGCADRGADLFDREPDMGRIIEVHEELARLVTLSLSENISTGEMQSRRKPATEDREYVRRHARRKGLSERETEILLDRSREDRLGVGAPIHITPYHPY